MKYEKLFEKGKIGKLTLKNRIVMTPMGTGFAAASGEASEEITKFYEERAKGGVVVGGVDLYLDRIYIVQ